jgi:adenylate kinase
MKLLILVSGPQGSGKSTQAERIATRFDAPIFEAGVELREMVKRNEPGSTEIEAFMKRGELVPHHYVDDLFREFCGRNNGSKLIISDGYPRNLPELSIAESLAKSDGRTIVGVNVDLDETTAIERIIARAHSDSDQADRPDTSASAIKERLRLYHEETVPVLNELRARHQLIVIDGKPTIEEVERRTIEALEPIISHASQ